MNRQVIENREAGYFGAGLFIGGVFMFLWIMFVAVIAKILM